MFIDFHKQGFTLIEILLVIAIIVALALFTLPIGIRFYKIQQLDSATDGIVQSLRRAQLKALSQGDNSFGVYVGSGQTGQYSLFKGNSYEHRTDEEVFKINSSISFSNVSEVVFSKLEGLPTITGQGNDIILTTDTGTKTIDINEMGRVNLE